MPLDLNGVTLGAITRCVQNAFTPAKLFAAGEQGAWYDPSDFSTLFQDAAGTTPVTEAGQPVGRILDKSGRGNHATQSDNTKRPVLQTSGGVWYLDFDGSNDAMATASINFTATDEMSVFVGVTKDSDASRGMIAELSATFTNPGSFQLNAPNFTSTPTYAFASGGSLGVPASAEYSNASVAAPVSNVVVGTADISQDFMGLRINGVLVATNSTNQGTGNFGNYPLYIGARAGTSLFFNGRLYSLIVLGRTATAGEITSTEQWVAGKTGVTI